MDPDANSRTDRWVVPRSSTTVGGQTVSYATFGDPRGVPVVVLHGVPGSRAIGAFFDAPATDRGVRVLAPDRPGVAGSAPVDDDESWIEGERRVVDSASFVAGFLDSLDVNAAGIVGFSRGGPHALACASEIPERTTGTALLAAPAPPDADVPRATIARLTDAIARTSTLGLSVATRVQAAFLVRRNAADVLSLYTDAPIGEDVVFDDHTVREVVAADVATALDGGHRALAAESRVLAIDWGFDPGTIGATVHVLHGVDDANVTPAALEHYERVLPDGRVTRDASDHLELLVRRAGDALDAAVST